MKIAPLFSIVPHLIILVSFPAIFCDYYNPPGECEWHYMPCGSPCMKTCRNPSGICSTHIPPLEGKR